MNYYQRIAFFFCFLAPFGTLGVLGASDIISHKALLPFLVLWTLLFILNGVSLFLLTSNRFYSIRQRYIQPITFFVLLTTVMACIFAEEFRTTGFFVLILQSALQFSLPLRYILTEKERTCPTPMGQGEGRMGEPLLKDYTVSLEDPIICTDIERDPHRPSQ